MKAKTLLSFVLLLLLPTLTLAFPTSAKVTDAKTLTEVVVTPTTAETLAAKMPVSNPTPNASATPVSVESSTPDTPKTSWMSAQSLQDWCMYALAALLLFAVGYLVVHLVRYFSVNGPEGEYYE